MRMGERNVWTTAMDVSSRMLEEQSGSEERGGKGACV